MRRHLSEHRGLTFINLRQSPEVQKGKQTTHGGEGDDQRQPTKNEIQEGTALLFLLHRKIEKFVIVHPDTPFDRSPDAP